MLRGKHALGMIGKMRLLIYEGFRNYAGQHFQCKADYPQIFSRATRLADNQQLTGTRPHRPASPSSGSASQSLNVRHEIFASKKALQG